MSRQRTNEEFRNEVFQLVRDEYTFLEPYITSQVKIKALHNACGHVWGIRPNCFLSKGTRCPKCGFEQMKKKQRRGNQEFRNLIFAQFGVEYTVLGAYINSKTPVECRHNICGFKWSVDPNSMTKKSPNGCPKCSDRLRKTDDEFRRKVFDQVGDEYVVLGEYVNAKTKVKMRHNACEHEWDVTPRKFVGKEQTRCYNCFGPAKKTDEAFRKEVFDLVGVEYTPLELYTDSNTKVMMRHNRCGHEWSVHPTNFLGTSNLTRCPKCKESKGETKVRSYLEQAGLTFETQYRIKKCKYQRPLPFDFAVFLPNNLFLLIEYDGQQHFKPIKAFGDVEKFTQTKLRDKIKTEFCKNNHIPLLRIGYQQFAEIENILDTVLLSFGVPVQSIPA